VFLNDLFRNKLEKILVDIVLLICCNSVYGIYGSGTGINSALFPFLGVIKARPSSLGSCMRGGLSSSGQMSRPSSQTDPVSSALVAALVAAVGVGRTTQSADPVPVRCRLAGGGLNGLALVCGGGSPKLSSKVCWAHTRGPVAVAVPPFVGGF